VANHTSLTFLRREAIASQNGRGKGVKEKRGKTKDEEGEDNPKQILRTGQRERGRARRHMREEVPTVIKGLELRCREGRSEKETNA